MSYASVHRYRSTLSVQMEGEVDVDEILGELSDDELLQAIASRHKSHLVPMQSEALITDAHRYLTEGDERQAILCLEQYLFPKFKTIADCVKRFNEFRTTPPEIQS